MRLVIHNKNFKSYKGRKEPKANQLVMVYKNLHNELWSIKDAKTGLVLGHTSELTLNDCSFVVSQRGRKRVLEEKRKYVHAYVVGHYHSDRAIDNEGGIEVTYNPYKDSHFTTHISNRKAVVNGAEKVTMIADTSKVIAKNIK